MILTAAAMRPLPLCALQGNPAQAGFIRQYTAPAPLPVQELGLPDVFWCLVKQCMKDPVNS